MLAGRRFIWPTTWQLLHRLSLAQLSLDHERDVHVDVVPDDFPILDHDLLLLDPRTLDVVDGLTGLGDTVPDCLLETFGDLALSSMTLATDSASPWFGVKALPVRLVG